MTGEEHCKQRELVRHIQSHEFTCHTAIQTTTNRIYNARYLTLPHSLNLHVHISFSSPSTQSPSFRQALEHLDPMSVPLFRSTQISVLPLVSSAWGTWRMRVRASKPTHHIVIIIIHREQLLPPHRNARAARSLWWSHLASCPRTRPRSRRIDLSVILRSPRTPPPGPGSSRPTRAANRRGSELDSFLVRIFQ
jgi:hypothetical protein